jgi:hypothetical protein
MVTGQFCLDANDLKLYRWRHSQSHLVSSGPREPIEKKMDEHALTVKAVRDGPVCALILSADPDA